jgi:two-component system, chemotaxis family, sensor kinase CheA
VAVLKSGEYRGGAVVDALLDEREAVVKDLGLPADMAGLSMGGVLLEDGTVAVVLDPAAVLDRLRGAARRPAWKKPPEKAGAPATILVVDDSITTRSLEKSILEAHGYRVRLAVDGVEALEQLRAEPADLVIADIDMPRMNGFELLERMKKDNRLAAIPVVMVTSLEDRADQERGLSLGADAYIVKRKFDQKELLDTVRQML